MVVDEWTGTKAVALQELMHLSLRDMAKEAGVSPSQVSVWRSRAKAFAEAGRPDIVLWASTGRQLDRLLAKCTPEQQREFELGIGGTAESPDVTWDIGKSEVVDVQRAQFLKLAMLLPPTVAAAAPFVLGVLDPDEVGRLIHVGENPSAFDAGVLANLNAALLQAKRLDDEHGPAQAIGGTRLLEKLSASYLDDAPPALRPQLHGLRAQIGTSAGWQEYDLGNIDKATAAYTRARDAADEAHDPTAGAMVLSEWGVMVAATESAPAALDKYVAADERARHVPQDPFLRAHTRSLLARGRARTGDAAGAMEASDHAMELTADLPAVGPENTPAYFATLAHVEYQRAKTMHTLGDLAGAEKAVHSSLRHTSPRVALVTDGWELLSAVRFSGRDFDGSADALVQCAKIGNSLGSERVQKKILARRAKLVMQAPGSDAVRKLDDQLVALGIAV